MMYAKGNATAADTCRWHEGQEERHVGPTIRRSVRHNYICILSIKVGDDLLGCDFAGDVTLYLCYTFYGCHRLQVNSNNLWC